MHHCRGSHVCNDNHSNKPIGEGFYGGPQTSSLEIRKNK